MTLVEWTVLAAAAVAGSVAQGATGFGCALVAVPMLLWGGVSLPAAISANTAFILVQGLLSCWTHRAAMPWKATLPMFALRLAFLPVGVAALAVMSRWGANHVKQAVGGALLVLVLLLYQLRHKPAAHPSALWTGLAGSSSGFLTGAVGMGGPPVVAWTLVANLSPAEARAFLWAASLQMVPASLVLLWWKFGPAMMAPFLAAIATFPLILIANQWGTTLGNRWSREGARRVTFVLLTATALLSLAAPWIERRPT